MNDIWTELAASAEMAGIFEPMACYNAAGDSIEFHLRNEAYHAKRLDCWLTVFIGEDSNEAVGGTLKGVVRGMLVKWPGIAKIEIQAGDGDRVPLAALLRVAAYDDVSDLAVPFYQSLIQASDDSDLTTSLQEA